MRRFSIVIESESDQSDDAVKEWIEIKQKASVSGFLRKAGEKGNDEERTWYCVSGPSLYWALNETAGKFDGSLSLRNCVVQRDTIDVVSEENPEQLSFSKTFTISPPRTKLEAETDAESKQWVVAVREASFHAPSLVGSNESMPSSSFLNNDDQEMAAVDSPFSPETRSSFMRKSFSARAIIPATSKMRINSLSMNSACILPDGLPLMIRAPSDEMMKDMGPASCGNRRKLMRQNTVTLGMVPRSRDKGQRRNLLEVGMQF